MALPEVVTRYAAQILTTLIATEIRSRIDNPPQTVIDVPATTPGDQRVGCPACDACDDAAKAKGDLEGVAAVAQERGAVPDKMRPVLRLARLNLEQARESVARVRQKAPSLGDQCSATERAIDTAMTAIPAPASATPAGVQYAAGVAGKAHQQAVLLALDFYELEGRARDGDVLMRTYEAAKSANLPAEDFYRKLKEALGG